jgi:hypothetical protein
VNAAGAAGTSTGTAHQARNDDGNQNRYLARRDVDAAAGALHSARRDEDKRGNELSDNSNECRPSTPPYMSELSCM